MPDIDLNKELGLGFSRDWQSVASSSRQRQQTTYDDPLCPPPADIAAHMLRKLDQPYLPLETSDDDYANLKLVDDLKQLELDASEHRFFGKSSGAMLIQTAIDLKQEYTGREIDLKRVILGQRRPEFWQPNTVSLPCCIRSLFIYIFDLVGKYIRRSRASRIRVS